MRAFQAPIALGILLKASCFVLAAFALLAYGGILLEGHRARALVLDADVVAARLGVDGLNERNTAFEKATGSAAIGLDGRRPSSAAWQITQAQKTDGTSLYLYLMADEPEFFSTLGAVTVTLGNKPLATIHALSRTGSTRFAPDMPRETILMPPERTLGYRIPLIGSAACFRKTCHVSIIGANVFWRVYRLAIIRETPRFRTPLR